MSDSTALEKTRAEIFVENAQKDIKSYRGKLSGDGTFDYSQQVLELQKLSRKMSQSTLIYLFGDNLGKHYFEKFVFQHNRDLLSFLSNIDTQNRFFILHELKNNPELFFH
jgi:hypothetical protein